jgi:MFS family permease
MQWYRQMQPEERSSFWACFGGWALDAMDVQLYAVVIPTLIAAWGLTKAQAGLLGTVALIVSSVGGWLAGILADRYGRVRVLQITIIWFSVFTFLSGFTNSYEQLFVTRALQGLGFGGEWAAGAVLIAETVDARYRGKAVAAVQSGWSVGYGAAAIAFAILFNIFPANQAWRYLFFIGLAPAALVFVIRRVVKEPKIYVATRKQIEAGAEEAKFWDIFRPPYTSHTLFASLLVMGILGGNYTVLTWLPTYLRTVRHLSYTNTGSFLLVNILGSFCGYIVGGYLTDFLGRRRAFMALAISAAVTVVVYMFGATSNVAILFLGFPLGFFQSGVNAGCGSFLTELFPTRIRGSAQGFCYNAGRGIGSVFPTLVGVLGERMALGQAIGVGAVVAYSLVVFAAFILPETKAKVLAVYA